MRTRTVLIIHERTAATARPADDLAAIAATLDARGLTVSYAHVSPDPSEQRPAPTRALVRSRPLRDICATDHAALVLCDHGQRLSALANDPHFARIARDFASSPRPLVAIARAPAALVALRASDGTSYLYGRRITLATDASEWASDAPPHTASAIARVRAAGADVRLEPVGAEHVVVDAFLITAQNLRSAASAARTLAAFAVPPAHARLRAS